MKDIIACGNASLGHVLAKGSRLGRLFFPECNVSKKNFCHKKLILCRAGKMIVREYLLKGKAQYD
jgi:hypothetical protein